MKKNAMLKIAAILLVAVLLTTCAISSTFAKYATSGTENSATARVAKWGVTANATFLTGDNLFLDAYGSSTPDGIGEIKHVQATDTLVAPGTYNSITIDSVATGTPEVSGMISFAAALTLENWGTYCPLIFKV